MSPTVAEQKALCPVRPGDIWRVGRHWFSCGDIEEGSTLRRVLALAPPLTLVYADPPWTSSNAVWYRSISEVDGKKGHSTTWQNVYRAALEPARSRGLMAYVECSGKGEGKPRLEAMALCRELGARTEAWSYVHYPWTDAVVFTCDFRPQRGPVAKFKQPWGWQKDHVWLTSGHTEPSFQALSAHPRGVMLDPCGGEGYTARSANHLGWTYVGHELTPRRMWNAMKRVEPDQSKHVLFERVG